MDMSTYTYIHIHTAMHSSCVPVSTDIRMVDILRMGSIPPETTILEPSRVQRAGPALWKSSSATWICWDSAGDDDIQVNDAPLPLNHFVNKCPLYFFRRQLARPLHRSSWALPDPISSLRRSQNPDNSRNSGTRLYLKQIYPSNNKESTQVKPRSFLSLIMVVFLVQSFLSLTWRNEAYPWNTYNQFNSQNNY